MVSQRWEVGAGLRVAQEVCADVASPTAQSTQGLQASSEVKVWLDSTRTLQLESRFCPALRFSFTTGALIPCAAACDKTLCSSCAQAYDDGHGMRRSSRRASKAAAKKLKTDAQADQGASDCDDGGSGDDDDDDFEDEDDQSSSRRRSRSARRFSGNFGDISKLSSSPSRSDASVGFQLQRQVAS
jgi:hypothetical protein